MDVDAFVKVIILPLPKGLFEYGRCDCAPTRGGRVAGPAVEEVVLIDDRSGLE
ncbi:MAG: hypothetical protein F7C82_03545 [Desulfurococcales archaeon]|nr:hypothetical protein [Desulfurococcales archaeon]